jgi:hypothetical protein
LIRIGNMHASVQTRAGIIQLRRSSPFDSQLTTAENRYAYISQTSTRLDSHEEIEMTNAVISIRWTV